MKRTIALLIMLCLILPSILAIAESTFPIVNEPLTIEVATWRRDGQVDYNDMLLWQKYEELTGIHVEWIHLPNATFTESRNALFIDSDNMPDAIYRAKLTMSDINRYSADGLLVPLDDLIENYAPNLKAFFETYPQVRQALTMEDGHIYSLGYFNLCSGLTVQNRQFINTSWLNEVGLDMPETIDDVTEMLRAFKQMDANGNGDAADEIPLASGSIDSLVQTFYGAFGLQNRGTSQEWVDIDKETGKLRFFPASEEYRKLLETLHMWYEEGLLDNDIFTMDTAKCVANGMANRYGMYCAVNLTNLGSTGELVEQYAGLENALIGPDGDQLYTSCKPIVYAPGSFVILDGTEHAVELIKWIDYFYSQEGAELLFLVDPLLYETDENGINSYNDYVNNNPDGLTLTQVMSMHTSWSGGNNPCVLLDNIFIGGETMPIPLQAAQNMTPYLPEEIWEPLFFTIEQNEEMAPIFTDLDACVEEMRAAFIVGNKSLDSEWDAYVKQLEDMKMQRYLEIVQEALDARESVE